jgi:hypothetical protein
MVFGTKPILESEDGSVILSNDVRNKAKYKESEDGSII